MSSPESKGERGEGPGQGPELKFAAARFISSLGTDTLLYLRPGDLKRWVWGEAGGISGTGGARQDCRPSGPAPIF